MVIFVSGAWSIAQMNLPLEKYKTKQFLLILYTCHFTRLEALYACLGLLLSIGLQSHSALGQQECS